jgi:beta-1,2-mannobiose phosphorylase / 1,2-beta-oligomannan phosphorylase
MFGGPQRALSVGLMIWALALIGPQSTTAEEHFPAELVTWDADPVEPVFTGAGPGHWDARIRERGWILRDGDHWRMWYTGYDGQRTGLKMLGLATSPDGVTWTRVAQNPLYREHWVEDVCVVPHDGVLYLFAEGFLDRVHLLTSTDGLEWQRRGLLDVRLTTGEPIPPGPFGTPTVYVENGVWHLFYERRDAGVWLATSTDLKVWTNVSDDPVLSPGPGDYDRDLVAMNQIVKYGDRYYAIYHGASRANTPQIWSTGIAVSRDLRQWTKYDQNPLRPISENKSSGQLVPDGDRFRLYTHHDKVMVHRHRP